MKTLKIIIALTFGILGVLCFSAIIATTGVDPLVSVGVAFGLSILMVVVRKQLPSAINMVDVCGELAGNILINCDAPIQAGTRERLIILNHRDVIAPVYAADNFTIVDLILASGAIGYVIDGKNNSIEPDTAMVMVGFNKMFDHMVRAKGFDISPETKVKLNNAKDGKFIAVTENFYRGTGGNSAFEVYGLSSGLEVTELTRTPNSQDTQGAFDFLFSTPVNKEPKLPNTLFDTDYATSLAVVDAFLV